MTRKKMPTTSHGERRLQETAFASLRTAGRLGGGMVSAALGPRSQLSSSMSERRSCRVPSNTVRTHRYWPSVRYTMR